MTSDYITANSIKGNWIDAKNLTVIDSNGKETLKIDSNGNVDLNANSLTINSEDVATKVYADGKFAEIKQTTDSITSRVSETEATLIATNEKIDNLQVGGRNLLLKTNVLKTGTGNNTSNQTLSLYNLSNEKEDMNGEKITLSFKYKISNYTSGNFRIQTASKVYQSFGIITPTSDGSFEYKRTITGSSSASTNNYVGLRMDNFNGSIEINNMKLEIGNIATAYTPAPEDIETRVYEAESKLTKDSLTTTIGTYYTTSSDVNGIVDSKGYATTSQVTQTVDSLTAKFETSGANNLLLNSSGLNGITHWRKDSMTSMKSENSISTENIQKTSAKCRIVCGNSNTSAKYSQSYRFLVEPSKTYTVSGKILIGTGCLGGGIYFRTSNTITEIGNVQLTTCDNSYTIFNKSTTTNGVWETFKYTFTTKATAKSGYLLIRNSGSDTEGTQRYVYLADLMFTEGEMVTPWTPHPSEVYSGLTTIDKDGIKVSQSDYSGYTQMKSDGFYVNNGTEDVISVTKDGANFKGNVTITGGTVNSSTTIDGGSIKTGTISADRIGAETITADKIAVGDFTNYVTKNPNSTGTNANGGTEECYDINKLQHTNISSRLYSLLGGESFLVKGVVKCGDVADTVKIQGVWRKADSTIITSSTVNMKGVANTSTECSAILTVPTKPSEASFFAIKVYSENTSSGVLLFSPTIRLMNKAEMIVDGSITADKIEANAIVGKTLNNGNGTFKVDTNGNMTSSSATITGGTLKIGSNFSVSNTGVLTAKSANFTGNVNSGSKITGATISGGSLKIGGNSACKDDEGTTLAIAEINKEGTIYSCSDEYPHTYTKSLTG